MAEKKRKKADQEFDVEEIDTDAAEDVAGGVDNQTTCSGCDSCGGACASDCSLNQTP